MGSSRFYLYITSGASSLANADSIEIFFSSIFFSLGLSKNTLVAREILSSDINILVMW